jgi:hypothetical protein
MTNTKTDNNHGYELILMQEIEGNKTTVIHQGYIKPESRLYYALFCFSQDSTWTIDAEYGTYNEAIANIKSRGMDNDCKNAVLEQYKINYDPNKIIITVSGGAASYIAPPHLTFIKLHFEGVKVW